MSRLERRGAIHYLDGKPVRDGDELELHLVPQPAAVAAAVRTLNYRPQGMWVRGRFRWLAAAPALRSRPTSSPRSLVALFVSSVADNATKYDDEDPVWPVAPIALPREAELRWPPSEVR